MSNIYCHYCDKEIDLDFYLDHFSDSELDICIVRLDNLDSIKYGQATYYHNKGDLELVETSEGEFDTDLFGYQLEFREAMREREEENKNNAQFPER